MKNVTTFARSRSFFYYSSAEVIHLAGSARKMWTGRAFPAGAAQHLRPFEDGATGREMFFTPQHIKAVQDACFDMHIHADGDASTRIVLNRLRPLPEAARIQALWRAFAVSRRYRAEPDFL